MKKNSLFFPVLVMALFGGSFAGNIVYGFIQGRKPTQAELIKDYYRVENAVHVSPHTVRKRIDKGDTNFILVDVRSPQEYTKEHVVTAINIPAYKDPNTSISLEGESQEKQRIIQAFRNLPKDQEIIVYCYSIPCMTGRKIGLFLAENGIYVKQLGIGWNEWRYFWNLWNHDGETPTAVADYIVSGLEPGKAKIKELPSPCGKGELGC